LARIFELIDFTVLPQETQPIARLLTDGFTQKQIATRLNRSEDWVATRVRELRSGLIEQALSRVGELDAELRLHLQQLRSSTAGVGGGRTGKRRTV